MSDTPVRWKIDRGRSSATIRVLIVDNDQAHAQAMGESLERVGYDCVDGHLRPGGARRIEQETFDVVITDLVMNDVDGMEILAQAKEALPDCEVIMVTGHAIGPHGRRGDAAGGLQLPGEAAHAQPAAGGRPSRPPMPCGCGATTWN